MKRNADMVFHSLINCLRGILNKLRIFYWKHFQATIVERNAPKWFADKGDQTLRLNYDLTSESTVIDAGGYLGEWTTEIFKRYGCQVHVFEPVEEFVSRISLKFSGNPRIHIHPIGLAATDRTEQIALQDNSSTIFVSSPIHRQIQMVNSASFFEKLGLKHIDLIKINIEGGEYELLEHLIATGFIGRIDNIQVQFHEFVPGYAKRMKKIRETLSQTHSLSYQYPMVWENWRRKS